MLDLRAPGRLNCPGGAAIVRHGTSATHQAAGAWRRLLQFNLPAWLEPLVRHLEPWLPALTAIGVVMALASALRG